MPEPHVIPAPETPVEKYAYTLGRVQMECRIAARRLAAMEKFSARISTEDRGILAEIIRDLLAAAEEKVAP